MGDRQHAQREATVIAYLGGLGSALLCGQCGEQLACMVKIGTAEGWCAACLDLAAEPVDRPPAHLAGCDTRGGAWFCAPGCPVDKAD